MNICNIKTVNAIVLEIQSEALIFKNSEQKVQNSAYDLYFIYVLKDLKISVLCVKKNIVRNTIIFRDYFLNFRNNRHL